MRGLTKRPRTDGCSPRLPAVGKPRNSPNVQAAVGPARDNHTAFVPGHRAEVIVRNFELEFGFAGSDVPQNDRRGFGGINGIGYREATMSPQGDSFSDATTFRSRPKVRSSVPADRLRTKISELAPPTMRCFPSLVKARPKLAIKVSSKVLLRVPVDTSHT